MTACAGKQSASLQRLYRHVDLTSHFCELLAHLFHAFLQDSLAICITITALFCILAHIVGDLHGAKLRAAHGAEVRGLPLLRAHGLVVHLPRRHGVQREVELVVPTELEAGLGEQVVPVLRPGVALGQVRSVGGDAVRDDARLDILAVRQPEVLLGGDVAQHGRPHGPDVGGPDGAGDVVVARRNVRGEGAQGVERRFMAPLQLLAHVLRDLVQGYVPRALVHHLHVLLPRSLRELPLDLELSKLGLVVGILDAAGA
mmetsp:Transcript_100350/g.239272  ORF Transcript_100350/g.239272 Transcript_100350/m.239272 type:complete len:257 (+) Transcript_100350:323-1093(+)